MRIAVMGAGAVGGYVGARLAQAGADVTLIARGDHLAALKAGGLRIDGADGVEQVELRAAGSADEVGPVDLVLFTVKLSGAEAAAATLAPLLGPQTRVLTLLNGIDSAAILARHAGAERVVRGTILISARLAAPGVIVQPGGARRMRVERRSGDAALDAFLELAGRAPKLDTETVEDGTRMIWEKFVMLAALSGVTSLARADLGTVFAHPETEAFLRALLAENLAVAAAEGVPFPPDHADRALAMLRGQPPRQKSSMLDDLEAGKPLELRWLSGRIAELAARHGIDAPASRAVAAALAPWAGGQKKA